MEYRLEQNLLSNIINIIAQSKQTGLSFLELHQIVKQLQALPKIEEKPVEKAKTPQVTPPHMSTIAPMAPVDRVMPEKAVIVKSKPTLDKSINNG